MTEQLTKGRQVGYGASLCHCPFGEGGILDLLTGQSAPT